MAAAALAMVLAASPAAWGQRRTDVVTLLNGDRFTGEIMTLDRGRLELKTDDAGTIEIEEDNIAGILGIRVFEVETSDGRRLLGSLVQGTSRSLSIDAPDGTRMAVPIREVTRITPIGASFWARLDGSVNAGFTYTQSSGVAQTTLNTLTYYRRPAFLFRISSSATVTEQSDDGGDDDRANLTFSYVRYYGRRLFVSGAASLENNESLGLELRAQVGGLVGARLVNTNRAQVEVGGGMVVNDERGVDAAPVRNVEGVASLGVSYFTYDRPKTQLDFAVRFYPSVSTWGRRRLQLDASASRELLKNFIVGVNGYYTFDSDPPNPDAANSDVGVVVSVGWTY